MTIPYREKFTTLNQACDLLVKNWLKEYGFHEQRLVLHWVEIVGEEVASRYRPYKYKQHNNGKATLFLVTQDLGAYGEFRYLSGNIMSKINTYFGYQLVADVKLNKKILISGQD